MFGEEEPDYTELLKQPELSKAEKKLRDDFVAQYFIDFNPTLAAQRIGFMRSFAEEYGKKFMEEPYVAKKVAEFYRRKDEDEEHEEELDKRTIRRRLMKEAVYYGPGSSHAARVSALSQLKALYGMDREKTQKHEVTHRGGVMMVPGISAVEDWEKEATESQRSLASATGTKH